MTLLLALTGLYVRSQIIADKPTVQEGQPEAFGSTSSSPQPSTSGCPFLQAINPPEVKVPWRQRLDQITKPYEFQQMLLDDAIRDGHRMVQIGKDIGFSDAYMPATGDAVKAVFAGEAGTDAIVKQSSIPSMGERTGESLHCSSSRSVPASHREQEGGVI
jgi:hypothetical protein